MVGVWLLCSGRYCTSQSLHGVSLNVRMADEVVGGIWDGGQITLGLRQGLLHLGIISRLLLVPPLSEGIRFFIASPYKHLHCRFLLSLANFFTEQLQLHIDHWLEAIAVFIIWAKWSTKRTTEAALEKPGLLCSFSLLTISKNIQNLTNIGQRAQSSLTLN